MIISEKQVMQLMDFAQDLLARLCQEQAPFPVIQGLSGLLADIAEQQSDQLIELKCGLTPSDHVNDAVNYLGGV